MKLFHEKVDKLKRLRFTERMFTRDTSVTLSFNESGEETVLDGPVGEDVDALALTLRFVLQPRDDIHLEGMRKLFQDLKIEHPARVGFIATVDNLLAFLDKDTLIFHEGDSPQTGARWNESLTHRRILELFLYGDLAHRSPEASDQLDNLRRNPFAPKHLQFQFNATAASLLRVLFGLQRANAAIVKELTGEVLAIYEIPKPDRGPNESD